MDLELHYRYDPQLTTSDPEDAKIIASKQYPRTDQVLAFPPSSSLFDLPMRPEGQPYRRGHIRLTIYRENREPHLLILQSARKSNCARQCQITTHRIVDQTSPL